MQKFLSSLIIIFLILFSEGRLSLSFAKQLDIHVVASQSDMNQGKYRIEFFETVSAGDTRTFNIRRFDRSNLSTFLTPFIVSPMGSYIFGNQNQTQQIITYEFESTGSAIYGYEIRPTAGILGSGFCNEDIAILAVYSAFPDAQQLSDVYDEVYVTFDIPETMPVYAPWTQVAERVFRIVGDEASQYYFVAAWGNFSSVELRQYGDDGNEHKFYMLGYGTDTARNFEITEYTYDFFMNAFNDNIGFLPPTNIAVVLPGGNYDYMPMGEGYGGYYFPNEVGDPLTVEIDNSGDHARCDSGFVYFNFITNGNELTVAPVHMSAHVTLNRFLSDWWATEGIAVYYQFEILRRKGIIDENLMRREFATHFENYKNDIYGTSSDYSLKDFTVTLNPCTNYTIAYIKGALAFYVINEIIKISTDGEYELIDFFAILFSMFKIGYNNSYSTFIEALNNLTGRDIQEFFERFIYNTELLPLRVNGDDIDLTYLPPILPPPSITANSSEGPLVVHSEVQISIEASANVPYDLNSQNADWWVAASTPFGWYSYIDRNGWQPGLYPYKQGPLTTMESVEVFNSSLPVGDYTVYFAVDDNMDGIPDATWLDSVVVQVFDLNLNFDFDVPYAHIVIDGNADDWAGIEPVLNDREGDSTCGIGTDIKSVYIAINDNFLFWLLDTWSDTYNYEFNGSILAVDVFLSGESIDHSGSITLVNFIYGRGRSSNVQIQYDTSGWTLHDDSPEYGQINQIAEGKIPLFLLKDYNINSIFIKYFSDATGSENCDDISN